MRVMLSNQSFNRFVDTYELHVARSRTYVEANKAVALGGHTTVRKDNGDFVFRLYSTDIVRVTPSKVATIRVGGWPTPTTFDRIFCITGVILFNNNKLASASKLRMKSYEYTHSLPFANGVCINLVTGEVLNPEIIPIDKREMSTRPTKAALSEFRKIWKPIARIAKIELAMQHVLNAVMDDVRNGARSTWQKPILQEQIFKEILESPCASNIIDGLRVVSTSHKFWNANETQVSTCLNKADSRLRKHLQNYWLSLDKSRTARFGGETLGEGYYSGE